MTPDTLFSRLAPSAVIAEQLLAIRSLPERELASLAIRSYLHSNGFYRIIVRQDEGPKGPCVRLHYWPGQSPLDSVAIHNHAWRFESRVLAGALRITRWAPTSDRRFSTCAGLAVVSEPSLRARRHISARLHEAEVRLYSRGDTYSEAGTQLHSVEAVEPSVTLVHQGPHVRPGSLIFGPDLSPHDVDPLSTCELRTILEQTGGLLAAQPRMPN